MNKDEIRRFVNDVHIGDRLRVEYDAGFLSGIFGDRNKVHEGYVDTLHVNAVALSSADPFSYLMSDRKPIGYDQITGYSKWENQTLADTNKVPISAVPATP